MTTHHFSIDNGVFSPSRITVNAGDKVRIKNDDTINIEVTFPNCFIDTAAATLSPGTEVTRELASIVLPGIYQMDGDTAKQAPREGDDLEGLTGEIEVDPDW